VGSRYLAAAAAGPACGRSVSMRTAPMPSGMAGTTTSGPGSSRPVDVSADPGAEAAQPPADAEEKRAGNEPTVYAGLGGRWPKGASMARAPERPHPSQ
jgi:hypothetical protein